MANVQYVPGLAAYAVGAPAYEYLQLSRTTSRVTEGIAPHAETAHMLLSAINSVPCRVIGNTR